MGKLAHMTQQHFLKMPVIFLQKQTDVYRTAKSHRHASPIALPTPCLPLSSSERDVDGLIANPPNRRDNVTLFDICVQLIQL